MGQHRDALLLGLGAQHKTHAQYENNQQQQIHDKRGYKAKVSANSAILSAMRHPAR